MRHTLHCPPLTRFAAAFACVVPFGQLPPSGGGICTPEWVTTFGQPIGTKARVRALAVYDDGSGAALFVGGESTMTEAGGVVVNRIAKWDGFVWSALGEGVSGGSGIQVSALAVYDDGSGDALYAAGQFTTAGTVAASNIAKWDGNAWSPLGSGVNNRVSALTVFDDGSGAALYAAGQFSVAGGVPTNSRVAKWNGSAWSAVGSPINGSVNALVKFDDGTGEALYAGGAFQGLGPPAGNYVAKWNGTAWQAVGGGFDLNVTAFGVHDDGNGDALYAGGMFTTSGGIAVNGIARWDGAAWTPLGTGIAGVPPGGLLQPPSVDALATFDDGSGAALYVCGSFGSAGGVAAASIAKWNGSVWSSVGAGLESSIGGPFAGALVVHNDVDGEALYAGGLFTFAGGTGGLAGNGGVQVNNLARWNGTSWSGLGTGANGPVSALLAWDGGGEDALYAGGTFSEIGGVLVRGIARWNGAVWTPLGSGMSPPLPGLFPQVLALALYDDGNGEALYAGGSFASAGGVPAQAIAKWDGNSWAALGSGLNASPGGFPLVRALAVYNDGTGSALYAGGTFSGAGGVGVSNVARWNGSSWASLGSGTSSIVNALAVYNDGFGSALFVGGSFLQVGGLTVNRIAKWNGVLWSSLGSGTNGNVRALAVHNDGGGEALFVGGGFTTAGGTSKSRIAKWNGASWSAVGAGANDDVLAFAVFDDSSGPQLYVGGEFSTAGGVTVNHVARWDGAAWSALATGLKDDVYAFGSFGSGGEQSLYVGGEFKFVSGPPGPERIARWRGCSALPSAFEIVTGCVGNSATLSTSTARMSIGAPVDFDLVVGVYPTGWALLYLGFSGTGPGGCGLILPGMEILLDVGLPFVLVDSGPTVGGSADFLVPVPAASGLVGLTVLFQAANIALSEPLWPMELTNGLRTTVGG